MVDLSVGEVSGFIAAGILILQLILPLALSAGLIAFITSENSVASWTILSRYLQSTHWPLLLNSDSKSTAGTKKRLTFATWLPVIVLILVSCASIVTPLGLYDEIEPGANTIEHPFSYIKDTSAFGYGTPPRSDAPFTRNCGKDACPGAWAHETCHKQGLLENCTKQYDNSIPTGYINYFKEGAHKMSPTVSSIFDIEWRTYVNATDGLNLVGWYLRSAFRQLSLLVLEDKIALVEGLVVDMKSGGIGFRNHTGPTTSPKYGATWTEDILFVEPESRCVDTKLTLDFKLPGDDTSWDYVEDLVLTDRGGFSSLDPVAPDLDPHPDRPDSFGLDLGWRAIKAAWVNNFLTMVYFNVTDKDPGNITRIDSKYGRTFPLPSGLNSTSFRVGFSSIKSSLDFGEYLNLTARANLNNLRDDNINPFNISSDDFLTIYDACGGATGTSPANINSTLVGCALLYGAANRTDGKSSLLMDPRSPWSVPIYSCASTVKATIKTVTFVHNGTNFDALKVVKAEPRYYSHHQVLPVWGVEDMKSFTIEDANPGWGVLGLSNSTNEKQPYNITTVTKAELYLPGYLDAFSIVNEGGGPVDLNTGQNLPGVDFYTPALYSALNIRSPSRVGFQRIGDYSGQSSLALYAKWQNLSTTADGAAKILNLVWTDIAANAVVGTKGWGLSPPKPMDMPKPNQSVKRADNEETGPLAPPPSTVPIIAYKRTIQYKYYFAIPAFIVALTSFVIILTLLVLVFMGRTGPKKIRNFLEITTFGRVIGLALWPEAVHEDSPKKDWLVNIRAKRVLITREKLSGVRDSLIATPGPNKAASENGEEGESNES